MIEDEVVQTIKQLNDGKRSRRPTEFYQLFVDDVINMLTSMYNQGLTLHSGCMRDSFMKLFFAYCIKKVMNLIYRYYRHLININTHHKIFAKIIMNSYILAISPLIKQINKDKHFTGTHLGKVTAIVYAYNINQL